MKNKFYSSKFEIARTSNPANYHLTNEENVNCIQCYDKLADLVINHEANDLPKDKLGNLLGMLYGSYTEWTKELLKDNCEYLTQIGVLLNNQQNIGSELYQQAKTDNLCNMVGMDMGYFVTTLNEFGN